MTKKGQLVKNLDAITDSWMVPLILLNTPKKGDLTDFLKVQETVLSEKLGDVQCKVKTLTRAKSKLLHQMIEGEEFEISPLYTLRLFVETYMDNRKV